MCFYDSMQTVTVDELKTVVALSELPDEHLQWVINHSEYQEYEDGTLVTRKGDPAEKMWIILEGKLSFYMDVNGVEVHYIDFANDNTTGGVTGMMPYSRMKTIPGNSYALGKVRRLELHKDYFQELEQLNPELIPRLIGYMTERARAFATNQLQQEKVSALGKLAAGIAHELNNPAAAITRETCEISSQLKKNYVFTEKLLQYKISAEEIHAIRNIVIEKEKEKRTQKKLSPMQRMEREDEIHDWLQQNGFLAKDLPGETFADAGFAGGDLESIRNDMDAESFTQVLYWMENLLSSQKLIKDLEEASKRISDLVGAIKSHVHMDQSNDLQPTDIHRDIENTLTLMGYKLREKNITVKKIFCETLGDVPAYVGELNQVWTNLIDNAIYAMPKNGELAIETICDDKNAYVKIIDTGAGIPPEIVSRIFDPFFSTKKMGEGSGIGLDLVKRVIKHHNGEVKVNSRPGRTEFMICIPLVQVKSDK